MYSIISGDLLILLRDPGFLDVEWLFQITPVGNKIFYDSVSVFFRDP